MPSTPDSPVVAESGSVPRKIDRRVWFVAIAGVVIAAVCWQRARSNQPYDYEAQFRAAVTMMSAPPFEGVDENNQMFRLAAYLGRHEVIVVFYDGQAGADRDPNITALLDRTDDLARRGMKVVAISQAIPQLNRQAIARLGDFPGVMISDLDGTIHQRWGLRAADGTLGTGLFLIDRKGAVASQGGVPRSYPDLAMLWKDLRT